MDKQTIIDMKPGRELDAVVAELMEYKAYKEKRGENELCVIHMPGETAPWMKSKYPQPERYSRVSCNEAVQIGFYGNEFPRFSQDLSVVWEVIKHTKKKKFSCRRLFSECLREVISSRLDLSDGTFVIWPDCIFFLEPEDICKAALLVMIQERDE
ncbi:MAG: hypothetical protein E6713_06135 [Sporomusaceae bacterium]|nr:hypothetical protein [Sporomusaceae bacterium]